MVASLECEREKEKEEREEPSLTCQPTLQYNIIQRKTATLHDIKVTDCEERYMKYNPWKRLVCTLLFMCSCLISSERKGRE